MSEAFKCDKCGEIKEGQSSTCLAMGSVAQSGLMWRVDLSKNTMDDRPQKYDLCEKCLREKVAQLAKSGKPA